MNKIKFTILLAAFALGASSLLKAQNDDFYAEIKSFMTENRADYNDIVASYFAGKELSLDDYTLLYYGYTFTDAYNPNYYNSSIDSLIAKKLYSQAYAALQADHKQDPTSLQTLFYLINIAEELLKPEESKMYQSRYINLVKAIMGAGGDGLSKENAIRVNRVTDEFQILSTYFGASSIVNKEFSEDFIDKVSIKNDKPNIIDIFFDFKRYVEVAK